MNLKEVYERKLVEDKKLSQVVFYLFLASLDMRDYSKKITELSNSCGKHTTYLRSLRVDYLCIASTEEKQMYDKKVSDMKSLSPEWLQFGDTFFKELSSFEERFNYLIENEIIISNAKKMLKKYCKEFPCYEKTASDFLKCYTEYYPFYCENVKKKKSLLDYNACLEKFLEVVNSGCYSITDYVQTYGGSKEYWIGIRNKIKKYDQYFKSNNWAIFFKKLEENRFRSYCNMKDRIDLLYSKICDKSIDIIDYYLIIGLSFDKFVDICKGNISEIKLIAFNCFLDPFKQALSNNPLCVCDINSTDYSFGTKVADSDTKAKLIAFMEEKNIPLTFFGIVLKKYYSGGLSEYIGGFQKTNSF